MKLTVVGHHHGDGAEESFQIIWQLSTSGVARVHGDEGGTGVDQFDFATFEHEAVEFGSLGVPDGDELLCDDGQHFDVDSVELVETTPRSRLNEQFNNLKPRHKKLASV